MDENELSTAISPIQDQLDVLRIRAEKRFLLLRDCEAYLERQRTRLGKKFRKVSAIESYCAENGISLATFYKWSRLCKAKGIRGLLPGYKPRGSQYDSVRPVIHEIFERIEPHKGYIKGFEELKSVCEQRSLPIPHYRTFLRMLEKAGLSDSFSRHPQLDQIHAPPPGPVQEKQTTPETIDPYIPDEPGWMRIVNRKAFNIAIYKYNLILPFLNPDLKSRQKRDLINEILSKRHFALPKVEVRVNQASLYRMISGFKRDGFEALVPKYLTRERRLATDDRPELRLKLDIKNPLGSLKQFRDLIGKNPLIEPVIKKVSLSLLDESISHIDSAAARYKPLFLDPPLTNDEIRLLEGFKAGPNAKRRAKAASVLMANDHRTILEIIAETGRPLSTIYRWLKDFREQRTEFIRLRRHHPEREQLFKERKTRIVDILHGAPALYGINRASWSYPTIAKAYNGLYEDQVSPHIAGRILKTIGYSWRRARKVLTSKDPQYREKMQRVLDVLQNLRDGDAFFFIDEAGPYQVRKYGGKCLTLEKKPRVVPQFQKPKGRVMLIGALEALSNQMTWTWIENKGVETMRTFIKILHAKYISTSRLFLTWDALSSHRSKGVSKLIDQLNSEAKRTGTGPSIQIVPLPNNSQFLNVVESVFSGMKRAVIHNSDYQSTEEMKAAISRHFEERNVFFCDNPKRAGNKIWDKQHFDIDRIQGGVFKRM